MDSSEKIVQRSIGDYQAEFQLKDKALNISLRSSKLAVILFACYGQDNMPPKLNNVLDTPEELLEALKKLEQDSLKVSNKYELVLMIDLFGKRKQYCLPLQKSRYSNNQSSAKEVLRLQQQISKMEVLSVKDQVAIQVLHYKNEELTLALSKMQTYLECLQNNVNQAEKAQEKCNVYADQLKKKTMVEQVLRKKLSEFERRMADGTGTVPAIDNKSIELSEAINELKCELQMCRKELLKAKYQLEQKQQMLNDLKCLVDDLKCQQQQKQHTINQLSQELMMIKSESDMMKDKKADSQEVIAVMKQQVCQLKCTIETILHQKMASGASGNSSGK